MVSVRCISDSMPGANSMTIKREPFAGGAGPRMRAPMSSTLSLAAISAGIMSLHHIKVEATPSRGRLVLVAGPSRMTLATFLPSCPVMTRRIGCSAMGDLLFFCWALRGRAGRALEIDEFDDVAVGIADIGAAADEHAGAAILFLENLDASGRQALQRLVVDLRRHPKRGMDFVPAGGILRDRIFRKSQVEEIIAGPHE